MKTRLALLLSGLLIVAGCSTAPSEPGPPTRDLDPTSEPAPPGPAERLGLTAGWGPSVDQLDRAVRLTNRLSLEELAGQVIVAAYAGTAAPIELVTELHLGGVIVFAANVNSAEQIGGSNARLHREVPRRWPLFVAVDQEGGIVARLSDAVPPLPTFMTAGAADDAGLTEAVMRVLGADLRSLGFTVDFAPVADVTSGPEDPTIGSRSAGADPELVARQSAAAAAGFVAAGVLPVLKHFPGHGSVPADSHVELPVQQRSRAELDAIDLVPFAGTEAPAVMVGHLDLRAVDPGTPSSLSRPVVTGILREDLGYGGLVVTDALDMAGVAQGRSDREVAVAALRAGADVLLMPRDPRAARDGIVAAVEGGELPRRRLRQAAARQVAALLWQAELAEAAGVPDADAVAAWSRAAVTLVVGPCSGRLVGERVQPVGDRAAVAAFAQAAQRAGLEVGGGDVVAFTGFRGPAVTGDVAVATDTPYVLGRSSAPVKIATYGATPAAMDALVAVLLGETRAVGTLPVPVPDVPTPSC
ncbi:glycoside hydrolase family 3 protein [Nocardioides limicola]|uniref:glycoside hydrolase family 3 protein n=1 Tax=Nocardioides limicola TaxID=2803368 RepID=UPI00193BE930|nr:glycoside hydrolase family 3 N-terminal domain-containing protein [Nocardioides sp. DJM-14]